MSAVKLTGAHLKQIEKAAPWLSKTCEGLLREPPNALDAYLTRVCSGTSVDGTHASAHCHIVALDGNGRPRVNALAKLLATSIVQYCIPRSEIERAKQSLVATNNPREMVALEFKAKDLFTHLTTSGEGGELLLYMLIETVLRLPQVLCKMPLKTSGHMHYHGVDGIHGAVDEKTGMLALYWGESKLQADVNNAIRTCFESIAPYLLESGSSSAAHERDLHLLRDNLDLNNPALEIAFQNYLDPDNSTYKQLQFRAACLIGFDSEAYPALPNLKLEEAVHAEIEAGLHGLWQRVQNNVLKQKLESFRLEVFCLPFPDVDAFRKAFQKELKID